MSIRLGQGPYRDLLDAPPSVMQVISVRVLRGAGETADDPIRSVMRYYGMDGSFLAEYDPADEEHAAEVRGAIASQGAS